MGSPSFSDIRAAAVVALGTVSELNAFDVWPDQGPVPPCAIVMPGSPLITYDVDFDGSGVYNIVVRLFVMKGTSVSAQEALDDYVAPGGTRSVKDALEGTLGGIVDWLTVLRCENYGEFIQGDVSFMGCEFPCEVGFSG